MEKAWHKSTDRKDWQEREGFTFVSDVAFQVTDTINTICPPQAQASSYTLYVLDYLEKSQLTPSSSSLYIVSSQLAELVPDFNDVCSGEYGASPEDIQHGDRFAHLSGVGELAFPWHFGPALAKAVADEMVDQGHLEQSEVDNWSLADWAGIIGTGWFSRTVHSLAYTRNSVYRTYGIQPRSLQKNALREVLKDAGVHLEPDKPLFDVAKRVEPADGTSYLSAYPSKQLTAELRDHLEVSDRPTVGCPAARFSTMLPQGMLDADPHVQNLLARGKAEVVPERSNDDETMVRLEWSPIDATLAVLASKLEQYEQLYGTPYVTRTRFNGTEQQVIAHHE